MAVGIALSSDVLASILVFTVVGSYISKLVPSQTMVNFSVFMCILYSVMGEDSGKICQQSGAQNPQLYHRHCSCGSGNCHFSVFSTCVTEAFARQKSIVFRTA